MHMLTSLMAWLKGGLKDKWRLLFLAFAVTYLLVLVFGLPGMERLDNMSIQWDEVTHLNGGALLLRGDTATYFSFNAFYPPMFDLAAMAFFSIGGVSVFTGRFVSVVFSLLSVYAVFEFGYRLYGAKTALVASVFLAIMPGYLWLSRMAMIETMMMFFFTASALFFFLWLKDHKTKFLLLSGLLLGFGVITKYQTIILGAIMLTSLFLLGRGYLKQKLARFPYLVIAALLVVLPWVVVSYQVYASGMLNQWMYALSVGNPEKSFYSTGLNRFPAWYNGMPEWLQTPIFYLLEMSVPYYSPVPDVGSIHPVSIMLFALGITGLAFMAWRRKPQDKYLLLWFLVVYIFFTAIPNKQWRYVTPLFPVLAFSASTLLITLLRKAKENWKPPKLNIKKRIIIQASAAALIAFTLFGTYYSIADAHSWVTKDQIHVPLDEATSYVAAQLQPGENVMVLCAINLMSQDMVRFFLYQYSNTSPQLYQYPAMPVDTYSPQFNITELVDQCAKNNIRYLMVNEYGQNATYPKLSFHYFNSTWTFYSFNQTLMNTGRFSYEPVVFWDEPARIFILKFR
jgi:4-amino-4-deoxy-L-arabinose transferase-like glycosyltransferase